MGVESFFNSLIRLKIIPPCIFPLAQKINTRYLLIDFNSIVHTKSKELTDEINKILYLAINNNMTSELDKFNVKYQTHIKNIMQISSEELDELVIKRVKMYIITILTKYINPDILETLYIAIDGTPTKAKMIEQRKRRYMNYIIYGVQKHIYQNKKNTMSQNRMAYESSKYAWNTGNITPGTIFMAKLEEELTNTSFKSEIGKTCSKLKEYIFSGTSIPGEAEKKLVNYAKNLPHKERTVKSNNITIYSPDSDVIILSMLLHVDVGINNNISGIKMLRHNQQSSSYEYVDIDLACEYLYTYISNQVTRLNLIKSNVIMDICFIFTLFGNDFVPKIESYDISHYFEYILIKYLSLLESVYVKTNKVRYMIETNPNEEELKQGKLVVINQNIFIDLIKELHIGEARNLHMIYLLNHYSNIDSLVKLFNTNKADFVTVVEQFLIKFRSLTDNIRKNIPSKELLKDNEFLETLSKIIDIEKQSVNTSDLVNNIITYYKQKGKFPELRIKFIKKDNSISSLYHQKQLEKSLDKLNPKEPLTEYDKNIYKFNRMLDEYQDKLGAYPSDIGKISINTRDYRWNSNKILDDVKKYYATMDITNITTKNPKMEALIYNYIEGLMWVFNLYFNSYHDNEIEYGDSWYYPYHHAPLLTQVYFYLREKSQIKFLDSVLHGLKKYKVARSNYFLPIEQLLYVTPPFNEEELSYVPDDYKHFFKNKIYINMQNVVMDILNNNNKLLDCKGARFLTKCHIHGTEFPISDNDFIYTVRKIQSKPIKKITDIIRITY